MSKLPDKIIERVIQRDADGNPMILSSLTPEQIVINQIIDYLKEQEQS